MESETDIEFNGFCYDQFQPLEMDSFLLRAYAMCYIYLFRNTAPLTIAKDYLSLVPRSDVAPQEAEFSANDSTAVYSTAATNNHRSKCSQCSSNAMLVDDTFH